MRQSITLPEISIKYSFELPSEDLLLVAGGRPPIAEWLVETDHIIHQRASLWCIDHGLDICLEAGLIPTLLIGDGDSAKNENWQKAEQLNTTIKRFSPEKDLTDTQLALNMAHDLPDKHYIILSGSLGGRLDHLFSTLFTFAHSDNIGCMADHSETVFFLKDSESAFVALNCRPLSISLLPITDCSGVEITGVYWPLHNADLTQRNVYAISNEIIDNNSIYPRSFNVKVEKGILAVYICWNAV